MKIKPILLALVSVSFAAHLHAENKAEALESARIEVVGTTPLASMGVPVDQVPAAVQVSSSQTIDEQRSLDLSELLDSNLGSVTTNNTVANPYQADVIYRGFTASPLLGTPQGLSVFLDGVRINEPFGDIVNWDLIPSNAIANINLIPGSNPLFGLNTLGGALSIHTKSGAENPGVSATLSGGSWGRSQFQMEAGGKKDDIDYFVAGNVFHEDGWRDHSNTNVKQLFSKVGWQNETSDLDLTVLLADNEMHGTQSLPLSMLGNPKKAYSWPDSIGNRLAMFNLKGSHFLSEEKLIAGNVYYRHNTANGFNSNMNNNYCPTNDGTHLTQCPDNGLGSVAYDPLEASNISTKTSTDGFGGGVQMTFLGDLMGRHNQFTGGVSADFGRTNFTSDTYDAELVGTQTVTIANQAASATVRLKADNDYYGLFATDTFSLNDQFHLTASGRYNLAFVDLSGSSLASGDSTLTPGNLDGSHRYSRFNPALGFNYNPVSSINFYGGYNEGMRAPSPIELSCADPAHPCALPNAFGGDPDLKKVVSRTFEGGVRGKLGSNLSWNAGLFRTENSNDILFIASNTSGSGYFQNVGQTLRQGFELGLRGKEDKLSFAVNYSYVDATFETPFISSSAANSSADQSTGFISVPKGATIPSVPHHTFKMRLGYELTPSWTVGTNMIAASNQYARGDENNQDINGKIPGYAVFNLDSHYSINDNWKVFAKINNLFDKDYSTFGLLGVNEFNGAGGSFNATGGVPGSANPWGTEQFRSPAAPRAAWVGVTYEFARPKSSGKVDND